MSSHPTHAFIKAKPLSLKIGICPKTLFRWAAAGHICRYVVNTRVVFFDETEVIAFIRDGRIEGDSGIGQDVAKPEK